MIDVPVHWFEGKERRFGKLIGFVHQGEELGMTYGIVMARGKFLEIPLANLNHFRGKKGSIVAR